MLSREDEARKPKTETFCPSQLVCDAAASVQSQRDAMFAGILSQ